MSNTKSILVPPITPTLADPWQIDAWAAMYRLLIRPDQVVELRALGVEDRGGRRHIESGFFDGEHLREMAHAAMNITSYSQGVYFTLNSLDSEMLARRKNRIAWTYTGEAASDGDVIRRAWLLVDADPVRKAHISATNEEKMHAYDTILRVREYLRAKGWSEPILADSGNGYHLFFPVDLPADDGGTVEQILKVLAHQFDNHHVKIDQTVFNPSRICKLPGTIARKGDSTLTRPHRQAVILEVPAV